MNLIEEKEFELVAPELADNVLEGVTFTRSSIHKGQMAPKGRVYFVATYKIPPLNGLKGTVYTMMKCIATAGVTQEVEDIFKIELARLLKDYYKIKY